jgi:hypothetical protein
MSQQTQSFSPEALSFAIIDVMPNELTPLIQRLKKWRTANDLSQSQAVAAFQAEGLPVTLDTLQNWEIGRLHPQPVCRRCPFRFFGTAFKNFKAKDLNQ